MNDKREQTKLSWSTPLIRSKVLVTTLVIGFLCYGFFTWILWPVKVSGRSMAPTYTDGSRHFINKMAYWSAKPLRGDVVALRARDGDIYIKRIVGLPGEIVSFESGFLHVNGAPVREGYTETRVPFSWRKAFALGEDDYFVIGDNRTISVLTPVKSTQIIGKVAF